MSPAHAFDQMGPRGEQIPWRSQLTLESATSATKRAEGQESVTLELLARF